MEYFELSNGDLVNLENVVFIGRRQLTSTAPYKEYIINLINGYMDISINEDEFNRIKKRVKPKFVFRVSS